MPATWRPGRLRRRRALTPARTEDGTGRSARCSPVGAEGGGRAPTHGSRGQSHHGGRARMAQAQPCLRLNGAGPKGPSGTTAAARRPQAKPVVPLWRVQGTMEGTERHDGCCAAAASQACSTPVAGARHDAPMAPRSVTASVPRWNPRTAGPVQMPCIVPTGGEIRTDAATAAASRPEG